VPVWGSAAEGERVEVSLDGQVVSTLARDGKWRVDLAPHPAGGPFVLSIRGNNSIELQNVMVGDVYLCSGQSNMEWTVDISAEKNELLAEPADPQLRLFLVDHQIADSPRDRPLNKAGWNCPRGEFSAVAYALCAVARVSPSG